MNGRLIGSLLALVMSAAPLAARAQGMAGCRDSFQYVLDGAREQWPDVSPFLLSGEHVRYFMLAYNAEVEADQRVLADRIVVVPLPPDLSSTWWYFGFDADCLSFYAELTAHKGEHLIESGYAMLNPEQRLQ